MALSKPLSFSEKLNKIEPFKRSTTNVHDEEIEINCVYHQQKAISVELIHHLLGGPNMEYKVINVQDSFDCFEYCANNVIDNLKKNKSDIMYLEHHTNVTSNVLVVRWFKFTLKPSYSITHGKLRLVIWDTSFWTFWVKFGHKGP